MMTVKCGRQPCSLRFVESESWFSLPQSSGVRRSLSEWQIFAARRPGRCWQHHHVLARLRQSGCAMCGDVARILGRINEPDEI